MFTSRDISFLKTLGEGTFGKVALVKLRKEVTDKNILLACKIIKKRFLLESRNADNIEREVGILRQLYGYPFFPRLYSTFEFYDRLCLLMEFCGGGEMFNWIRSTKGLSHESIKFYGAEIILALKKLRSLGILYRDLKSENVLLTIDGHIKIVDFGLAIRTSMKAWGFVGTTECVSPEVLKYDGYGPEYDLWSYGVLLYEMAHCRTPFEGPGLDHDKICERILTKDPVFKAGLDENYVDVVKKLLCKDPKKRIGYKDVEELISHPFFAGIDWEKMERLGVKPPTTPQLSYRGDSKYFGKYRESVDNFEFPPVSFFIAKSNIGA